MYKKGAGNDKQGKDAGNRTLCPYRNFSQALSMCTIKFCCYRDNHLEKIKCPLLFPGDERYLKCLFYVCISLCTVGIGLSCSKGNSITFCYTLKIHEFWVKIMGVMQVSISSITIPPGQTPGHDLKGAKPLPRDNHCVQKPSPRARTGTQKPHSRDIKLENFSNISMNSDTI